MSQPEKPPIYTLLTETLDWTLDRTGGFPKQHRFTIARRIDEFTLDAMECCLEAIYAAGPEKRVPLRRLNLLLEKLRVFWRIAHRRAWIAQNQLFFVVAKIDEIGRMTGAWLKSIR
jgi:hypothetical protein